MTPSRDISRLIEIMAALRTPVTGCPWDLEQNFATIVPYTIEEAYEVADAITRGDFDDLRDELGDLLLQVVYHARMAEEQNAFAFGDVVEAITRKMIRRHPHVFADKDGNIAPAGVKSAWERIKAEERNQKASPQASTVVPERREASSPPGEGHHNSILDGVPVALPALARAVKLQHKAARVGFDWPSLAPVFAKLKEELGELERAIAANPPGGQPARDVVEEFGDLLFVVANVARHLKVDPEAALRTANHKFTRRFRRIEQLLADDGRSPAQSSLEEMDRLWDRAKTEERKTPS